MATCKLDEMGFQSCRKDFLWANCQGLSSEQHDRFMIDYVVKKSTEIPNSLSDEQLLRSQ